MFLPPRLRFALPERSLADWLGLSGSTLCLMHCLAAPVLFGASVAGGWHVAWLDWLFGATALVAVLWVVRTTPLPLIRHLLLAGLCIFLLGFVVDQMHLMRGDWFHVPGAALLLVGHLMNLRQVLRYRACAPLHSDPSA